MKNKAIFLDRDGIITKIVFDNGRLSTCKNIKEVEVFDGTKEALDKLSQTGFLLIIITNQPNINRGEMTVADMEAVHNKLKEEYSLPLDAFYYCPHESSEGCSCKKPKRGMIDQALIDFPNINLSQSFLIGDRVGDIELGENIGCKTILIPSEATHFLKEEKINSNFQAANLLEAANIILNND